MPCPSVYLAVDRYVYKNEPASVGPVPLRTVKPVVLPPLKGSSRSSGYRRAEDDQAHLVISPVPMRAGARGQSIITFQHGTLADAARRRHVTSAPTTGSRPHPTVVIIRKVFGLSFGPGIQSLLPLVYFAARSDRRTPRARRSFGRSYRIQGECRASCIVQTWQVEVSRCINVMLNPTDI